MSEDWKIQISKKIDGDLLNIRANSAEEFAELAEGLAKNADAILTNVGSYVQVVLAKNVQTGDFQDSGSATSSKPAKKTAGRKATGSGVPSCAHGPMKDFSDRNYKHRYYCPSPNRDEQCDARD